MSDRVGMDDPVESGRSGGTIWTWLVGIVLLMWGLIGACGLIPPSLIYRVRMKPAEELRAQDGYGVDPEDSTFVFRKEGLMVKVRYLPDEALNQEYAKQTFREPNLNPYTYGTWRDIDLGYTPMRFTVFQVTVRNIGYGKVLLDPAKTLLLTDRGDRLEYWDVTKRERTNDVRAPNNFEEYYRALAGPSGNDQYWYQERIGIVRSSLYHRDKPVFKGQRYSGKLVFAPLHQEVKEVTLVLQGMVIRFDRFGRPAETADIRFPLRVIQEIQPRTTSETR